VDSYVLDFVMSYWEPIIVERPLAGSICTQHPLPERAFNINHNIGTGFPSVRWIFACPLLAVSIKS